MPRGGTTSHVNGGPRGGNFQGSQKYRLDARVSTLLFSRRSPFINRDYLTFSVVLFRSTLMLFSEKNRMKVLKINGFDHAISSRTPCVEPQAEDKSMAPRGASHQSGDAFRNSQARCTHNLLCTKHFHGVPSASPYAYSLESLCGEVSDRWVL